MIVLMKFIYDYMGNMNSVEVVHNTESGGRAIHAVELQPGNSGAFAFPTPIFAMLFCTILNCFYPNGLCLMGGLLTSGYEQNYLDSDRIITFMKQNLPRTVLGHLP